MPTFQVLKQQTGGVWDTYFIVARDKRHAATLLSEKKNVGVRNLHAVSKQCQQFPNLPLGTIIKERRDYGLLGEL